MSAPEVIGEADSDTAAAVSVIVSRCAPWVRLCLGHAIVGGGCWGLWVPDGVPSGAGCIAVATEPGYVAALDTAHHECWHAVEGWLSPEALGAVSALTAEGAPVPSAYLAEASERRARMYAALARAWDEGLRLSVGPADRAVAVMHAVYVGAAAHEIAAIRARNLGPPRSRARRAWDFLWT